MGALLTILTPLCPRVVVGDPLFDHEVRLKIHHDGSQANRISFRGNRGRGARGRGKPRWSRLDLSEDRTAPSSPLNYTPPVRPSAATSHANTPNYIQEGHTMANQSDATSTPSSTGSDWSDIQENSINIEKLRLLCATRQEQKKQGYVLEELSDEELVMKMRCAHCHSM